MSYKDCVRELTLFAGPADAFCLLRSKPVNLPRAVKGWSLCTRMIEPHRRKSEILCWFMTCETVSGWSVADEAWESAR